MIEILLLGHLLGANITPCEETDNLIAILYPRFEPRPSGVGTALPYQPRVEKVVGR